MNPHTSTLLKSITVSLVSLINISQADVTHTWSGNKNNNWDTDNNWSSGGVGGYPNDQNDAAYFSNNTRRTVDLRGNTYDLNKLKVNLSDGVRSFNNGKLDFRSTTTTKNRPEFLSLLSDTATGVELNCEVQSFGAGTLKFTSNGGETKGLTINGDIVAGDVDQLKGLIILNSVQSTTGRWRIRNFESVLNFGVGNALENSEVIFSRGKIIFNDHDLIFGSLDIYNDLDMGTSSITVRKNDESIFHNVVSGSGGVTKRGYGALRIGSPQTYTGTTRLEAGQIQFYEGEEDEFGSLDSSAVIMSSGTLLELEEGNAKVGRLEGFGTVQLNDYQLEVDTQSVLLATFGGKIQGTANSKILKTGGGIWKLTSNESSFSGPTTVVNGALEVANDNPLFFKATGNSVVRV